MCQWKNFENRLIFGEDNGQWQSGTFLRHSVQCTYVWWRKFAHGWERVADIKPNTWQIKYKTTVSVVVLLSFILLHMCERALMQICVLKYKLPYTQKLRPHTRYFQCACDYYAIIEPICLCRSLLTAASTRAVVRRVVNWANSRPLALIAGLETKVTNSLHSRKPRISTFTVNFSIRRDMSYFFRKCCTFVSKTLHIDL